jgi:hypothetical protein
MHARRRAEGALQQRSVGVAERFTRFPIGRVAAQFALEGVRDARDTRDADPAAVADGDALGGGMRTMRALDAIYRDLVNSAEA